MIDFKICRVSFSAANYSRLLVNVSILLHSINKFSGYHSPSLTTLAAPAPRQLIFSKAFPDVSIRRMHLSAVAIHLLTQEAEISILILNLHLLTAVIPFQQYTRSDRRRVH
jgi:hypothetical protein